MMEFTEEKVAQVTEGVEEQDQVAPEASVEQPEATAERLRLHRLKSLKWRTSKSSCLPRAMLSRAGCKVSQMKSWSTLIINLKGVYP